MPRRTLIKLRPLLALHAALLLLALVPTGASAYMSPGESIADPQVDAWLNVARATWGQSPECPEGVRIDRAERLAGAGTWAAAELPGCHISLDPDFYPAPAAWAATARGRRQWAVQMCNVVVHEWGHLLGHGHSSDAHDLMAPVVPLTVGACRPGAPSQVGAAVQSKGRSRKSARSRAGKSRRAAARRAVAKASSHADVVAANGPATPGFDAGPESALSHGRYAPMSLGWTR